MRRIYRGVAISAVLAMSLAACSSGSDDGGGDSGGSGAQAQSGTSLLIWADEKRAGPVGDLAKKWGEENGVDVKVTQVTFDQMKETFLKQAPQGKGPDILLGANDFLGEFVPSGLAAPVQLGSNAESFTPASVNAFTLDNQTYGVPVATENIALFRNTDLAPDAPESIEAMAQTGLDLQKANKTRYPIGVQVGTAGDAYHAYPFLSAAGGAFFPGGADNPDQTKTAIGDDASVEFAKRWGQLGKEGAIKSTFEGADLAKAFTDGKLAYFVTGPWNGAAIKESGVKFTVEAVPGWDGVDIQSVPIVGAQGFILNAKSNNKTTAQAFLDATMSTDFMNSLFQADPRPPAWKESASAAESDPIIKGIGEFGANGFPNLPSAAMSASYAEVGLAQKKILDGADPTATIKAAGEAIQKQLDKLPK